MGWIKPKTDWTPEYRGDYEDFNRISGNINYLKEMADELFHRLSEISLNDERTKLSYIYAREMNDIEDALESLNIETYGLEIGEKQTYKANGSTPLWSEFNRIESACLLLFEMFQAHKDLLPGLSFVLGGQKGIKV